MNTYKKTALSGGSISSGTVAAARLPVFGASGSAHAPGIVPDPGATAGTTRFLREDGTWAAPSGTLGATGLTGYMYANGSSATTASATIPFTAISGVPTYVTPTTLNNGTLPASLANVQAHALQLTNGATPWAFTPYGGAFDLNNGTADGNPFRGYYAANKNLAFNVSDLGVPATCGTGEVFRFVNDDGETGGAVIGAIDANGQLCGWSGVNLPSTAPFRWNGDTGLSRDSAGVVDLGNGTVGDKSGSLNLASVNATGPSSFGTGSTVDGSAIPVVATPTAGHAACIKAAGPPVVIGFCSSAVGSDGSCTCN